MLLLLLFSLLLTVYGTETEIKNMIFQNYSKDTLPNNIVHLKLGMAIRSLNNIDQVEGTISSNIWLRHWWNDPNISWNKTEWNISKIAFYTDPEYDRSIWIPDMFIYNTAEKPMDELYYTLAMVYSNGDVMWSRPGMMKTSCVFDLKHFPYDQQTCIYKFGSWVYDSSQLNLSISAPAIDLGHYQINQEWEIVEKKHTLEEKKYNCCPEKFQAGIYSLKIRRKPGYYILNIILPTFATSTLMVLSLLIPWDSGERISFAVTVMLSIIVFLLILSESLPKTNTKPLLSKMLIGLVFFSLFVVFSTVVIGIMHSYTKNNSKFAKWLLGVFNKYNIGCKKKTMLNRNDSYLGTINALTIKSSTESNEDNDCDKLATIIERIFTSVFLIAFIIYCAVIFGQKPSY
jgi:nicotinic acetylcholine receptor, invertebrate